MNTDSQIADADRNYTLRHAARGIAAVVFTFFALAQD
jgi:hypothetical protein